MPSRSLQPGQAKIPVEPNLQLTENQTASTLLYWTRGAAEALRGWVSQIQSIFSSGISLGSSISGTQAGHLDAQRLTFITPTAANTEFLVPHSLGRVAQGFIIVYAGDSGRVYCTGRGSLGKQSIRLKATTGGSTFDILVF